MKDLKLAGQVNEAAVVQSTAQYYSILASITDLESSLVEANNSMSLLMNVMPQQWEIPAGTVMNAPAMIREGVPMRELAARPTCVPPNAEWRWPTTPPTRPAPPSIPASTSAPTEDSPTCSDRSSAIPATGLSSLPGSLTAPLFAPRTEYSPPRSRQGPAASRP